MTVLVWGAAVMGLAGCSPDDDRRRTGYSDGYTDGYNHACRISRPSVDVDWSDTAYSRGFVEGSSKGVADGIAACGTDGQD